MSKGPKVPDDADKVLAKVSRRVSAFVFLALLIGFMDRINLGHAGLRMNEDLGLTSAGYGLALTAFFTAYILFEIPSMLALRRYGARFWIGRIMITWGIASSATMFATGPVSLYVLRAIVGAAEAGLVPGILLYLTYWFPSSYRARTTSYFLMGIPATTILVAPLSALLLNMDGILGLAGWRWLLLLEGLPAIALGLLCFRLLDNTPAEAGWLTDQEKLVLARELDQDFQVQEVEPVKTIRNQLRSPKVLTLALAYLGVVTSLNAISTWTPQIIREIVPNQNIAIPMLLLAGPAFLALVAMPLCGSSSDKRRERVWHFCGAATVAVVGWTLVATVESPGLRYFGLSLVSAGSYCAHVLFWTLPTSLSVLSSRARAMGIAFITMLGNAGGAALGPLVIGLLRDHTGSFIAPVHYIIAMVSLSILCVFRVGRTEGDRVMHRAA